MSVSARLPCCLSRGHLKREFLDIYLSKCFGVGNLGNTEAMRVMFFSKFSKFNADLENSGKKKKKRFFVFEINASELFALNRLY